MYEVLMGIATFLIFVMFIPANGFPILLGTTDWRRNTIGKSLMTFAVSFAALVDFSLLFKLWVGEDVWHALITVAVFLGINVGLWWVFFVIWKLKRESKREHKEMYGEAEN